MRRLEVVALAPLAFVVALVATGCTSKVSGSVSSKGGDLGTFTVSPTKCESGQHWQFFGAAFFVKGDDGSKVEVVQDPVRGWFVKVGKPGTKKMEAFGDEACKVLDVDVHNTNTTVNDIRVVEGSAKFECTDSKEGVVRGELTFSGCD
jgi:hypothetical protein